MQWELALLMAMLFLDAIPNKALANMLTTRTLVWERKRLVWTTWLRIFKVSGHLLVYILIGTKSVCIGVVEELVKDEWKISNGNGLQMEVFPSYLAPLLANTWSCKMFITFLSIGSRPNLDIGVLLNCHFLVELSLWTKCWCLPFGISLEFGWDQRNLGKD